MVANVAGWLVYAGFTATTGVNNVQTELRLQRWT